MIEMELALKAYNTHIIRVSGADPGIYKGGVQFFNVHIFPSVGTFLKIRTFQKN